MNSLPPSWSDARTAQIVAQLQISPGTPWAFIWLPQPVNRAITPHIFYLKQASDPLGVASSFTLPWDEVRPFDGFTFELFGRVTADPIMRFYQLEPTPGLEHGLKVEVWWMNIPVGPHINATLQSDPSSGRQRRILEVTDDGDDWEQDAGRIVRATRALHAKFRKPGPAKGTRAKFPTKALWHKAIRDRVLTKQTVLTADDTTIAYWLGDISTALLYRLMAEWGPKTLDDLREGRF